MNNPDPVRSEDRSPVIPSRNESEEAYDFPLFARSVKDLGNGLAEDAERNLHRIALKSPSPVNREPGFVTPQRPEVYYFTGLPSEEKAEHFRQAAVTGKQMLEASEKTWVRSNPTKVVGSFS